MLEAVLKRIKYVKQRSHPAKNWMAFIIMGFSLLSEMEFFAVPKNGISLNI